jgi:hypothetical protein
MGSDDESWVPKAVKPKMKCKLNYRDLYDQEFYFSGRFYQVSKKIITFF